MDIEKVKVGSHVYYTSVGICEVKEKQIMTSPTGEKEYLVLETINEKDSCRLFIPVDNPTQTQRIHHLLTKDEIDRLLEASKNNVIDWNQNRKERTEHFTTILRSYEFDNILSMVSCLYLKSNELKLEKKRLSTFDSETLNKAQRIIDEMLSFTLKIPKSEVRDYIQSKLI